MPRQQVEFQFPHETEDDGSNVEIEIEPSSAEEIDLSDKAPEPEPALSTDDTAAASEAEVEVVDDTPPEDRGREPSDPPEEVTEDELEHYSDRVRKRMKHFSKGYHDERRAKEAAVREREELESVVRRLYGRVQELEGESNKSRDALVEQAKQAANTQLDIARREYKQAYEAGDVDAVVDAQEKLTTAKFRVEQLNRVKKPSSLQEEQAPVQDTQVAADTVPQQPQVDAKAVEWQKENTWFGAEEDMTAFALGVHQKLVNSGVSPQSDEYYEQVNARVQKAFPEYFAGMVVEDPPQQEKQKPSTTNVVAPATRSTSPKKIRLTQSQVRIATRLGLPLDVYAKQLAAEMRKADG